MTAFRSTGLEQWCNLGFMLFNGAVKKDKGLPNLIDS